MGPVLILTDDPDSGRRLARSLGGSATICDLYDIGSVPTDARLLIGDIRSPHSDAITRLKRVLATARGPGTPFLYLIHGGIDRGEIQATMLNATRSMPASTATAILINAVAGLANGDMPLTPAEHVQAARKAFEAIFTGEAPGASVVDAGTDIVVRAIHDMKVRDWLSLVARFDDLTHKHCLMVAGLAAAFAKTLKFNATDAHLLTKGALLHDVGKSKIPVAILNKPGRLTPEERDVMKLHPMLGFDMLKADVYNEITLQVVRSHHELLDGSGYPDKLRDRDIPDLVRLVTICDIFAALIEVRPYKASLSAQNAYRLLTEMTGKLDPDLLRAFTPVAFAAEGDSLQLTA